MGNTNQKLACCTNKPTEKSLRYTNDDPVIFVTNNAKNAPSNSRSLIIADVVKQSSKAVYPDLYKGHFSSPLISSQDLEARTKEIAEHIHATYPVDEPLVMLCILKGSVPFYNLLCNQLALLGHPFMLDFYRVKSYVGDASSGSVTSFGDLPKSIRGRHVLIIEDIVDTGTTLKSLLPRITNEEPKSCSICSMLVKRLYVNSSEDDDEDDGGEVTTLLDLDNNLIGFNIPNVFVVGCGLDYNEMYRDLSDMWILGEVGIKGGGYGL
jgi:hypoxanthine phosphoribosyltransferase